MKNILKRDEMYYLVLHKDGCLPSPVAIVPVKYVKPCSDDREYYEVEQSIKGIKNRMTVRSEWLAPYDILKAKNLVHNMKMRELRIEDNAWRFNIDHKTARKVVLDALAKLPKKKQKKIWGGVKKVRPDLLKADGSLKVSKIKMPMWRNFAWGIICERHPLKEVWPER